MKVQVSQSLIRCKTLIILLATLAPVIVLLIINQNTVFVNYSSQNQKWFLKLNIAIDELDDLISELKIILPYDNNLHPKSMKYFVNKQNNDSYQVPLRQQLTRLIQQIQAKQNTQLLQNFGFNIIIITLLNKISINSTEIQSLKNNLIEQLNNNKLLKNYIRNEINNIHSEICEISNLNKKLILSLYNQNSQQTIIQVFQNLMNVCGQSFNEYKFVKNKQNCVDKVIYIYLLLEDNENMINYQQKLNFYYKQQKNYILPIQSTYHEGQVTRLLIQLILESTNLVPLIELWQKINYPQNIIQKVIILQTAYKIKQSLQYIKQTLDKKLQEQKWMKKINKLMNGKNVIKQVQQIIKYIFSDNTAYLPLGGQTKNYIQNYMKQIDNFINESQIKDGEILDSIKIITQSSREVLYSSDLFPIQRFPSDYKLGVLVPLIMIVGYPLIGLVKLGLKLIVRKY